jgi:hypothetical protein
VVDPAVSTYLSWLETTYAPGTVVKITIPTVISDWNRDRDYYLGAGARLEVTSPGYSLDVPGVSSRRPWMFDSGYFFLHVLILDARDESGMRQPAVGNSGWVMSQHVEPMVDNWRGQRRTSRGRHHLPRSQRSWMKPNVSVRQLSVPLPDPRYSQLSDYIDWVRRTYAPGTPVKVMTTARRAAGVRPRYASATKKTLWNLPVGARGEVIKVDDDGHVLFRVVDARDEVGYPLDEYIGVEALSVAPEVEIEPLVDNWASSAAARPAARYALPHSQRAHMKPNPEGLDVEVGDTLELERHPIYDHPGDTPSYKVTKRKVKSIKEYENGSVLVRLVGMRRRISKGHYIDKSFRLSGNAERGWWLWSGPPGPTRYAVLEVHKKR